MRVGLSECAVESVRECAVWQDYASGQQGHSCWARQAQVLGPTPALQGEHGRVPPVESLGPLWHCACPSALCSLLVLYAARFEELQRRNPDYHVFVIEGEAGGRNKLMPGARCCSLGIRYLVFSHAPSFLFPSPPRVRARGTLNLTSRMVPRAPGSRLEP